MNLFQVSIPEYCDKMKAGQREIFYLSAPSRQLAENSPYYENLKKADTEVHRSVYKALLQFIYFVHIVKLSFHRCCSATSPMTS